MKRYGIGIGLILIVVLTTICVMPVSAQAIERTLNPNLLPLHYYIDDGDYHVFGVGFTSVDATDSFSISISVDMNEQDEWKDAFDVSGGPWLSRFQVWIDGASVYDDDSSLPSFWKTIKRSEYGSTAIIRVRAEASYQHDDGEYRYIYVDTEMDFSFSPQQPLSMLPLIIGIVAVVVIIGGVVAFKRRKGREEDVEVAPEQAIPKDAKVLIVCPYCGAKTEQGLLKCQNCSADL